MHGPRLGGPQGGSRYCVQELNTELERTDLNPEHRHALERRMVQRYLNLAQLSMAGPKWKAQELEAPVADMTKAVGWIAGERGGAHQRGAGTST